MTANDSMSSPSSKAQQNGVRRPLLMAVLPVLAVGVYVAAYLVYAKLKLEYDPSFKSACNFGAKLNCDVVQTSEWSTMFGLPIALFGVPTYALMAWLALLGLRSTPTAKEPRAPELSRAAVHMLGGVGLLTCIYAIYLGAISLTKLGTLCPFCITLYAVNLTATVLTFFAARESFGSFMRGIVKVVGGFRRPILSATVLTGVAFVASYGAYASTRQSMVDSFKAQLDEQLDAAFDEEEYEEVVVETTAPQPVAVADPGTAAPGVTTTQPAQAAPVTTTRRVVRKPKAKMTDNGLSYFEAPVGPEDFAMGPADARVTVVKFADFQCGYCRILDLNIRPLEEKYKGQVRWVMKHYPMNADCNPRMGGDRMHENACHASYGALCAGKQGKFWEMHNKLYDNQQRIDPESIKGYAKELGLDMPAWEACLKDPGTKAKIQADIAVAGKAGIWGTPRAYVNGRLISGSAGKEILDYYIQKTLELDGMDEQAPEEAPVAAAPAKPADQVKARTAKGEFWIDAYEASVDAQGKAVSLPGVDPAQISWFDAKSACEKAGKRLCTEEEWVSACTGKPAIDNNNNSFFADDDVEGRMYPYGVFYEKGTCRDAEDEYKGEPGKTAASAECRTPDGIYDLAGNLMEWVGEEQGKAALTGGDWRGGERAACNRRTTTFGPGVRNNTTGFRCCSDAHVAQGAVKPAELQEAGGDVVGKPLPQLDLETSDGGRFKTAQVKGKVTYLTFFASWCGSCKRELPQLSDWYEKMKSRGFQVVAVGVDRVTDQSKNFVGQFNPTYPVAFDPEAKTMGLFDINAMPTSFLIDRQGIVRHREVGFKAEEVTLIQRRIEDLLAK